PHSSSPRGRHDYHRCRAQHGPGDEDLGSGAGHGLRAASFRGHARRGPIQSERDCSLSRGNDVTALLQAEGLQLAYGEISACRDVSLHVAQGEIVMLIGATDAGKSTTLPPFSTPL